MIRTDPIREVRPILDKKIKKIMEGHKCKNGHGRGEECENCPNLIKENV